MELSVSSSEEEKYLRDYNANLEALCEVALRRAKKDKSNFATIVYNSGEVVDTFLDSSLEKVKTCAGESDFAIISLIRLLFLNKSKFSDATIQENIDVAQKRVCFTLSKFPFWPACDEKASQNVNDIVFWSENHLFMTLGSAHLFYQYHLKITGQHPPNYDAFVEEAFRKYLALHLHPKFGGVYEVNSHVYLPYTMAALLNLIDFAADESVRVQAEALIDLIVHRLMLTTDPLLGVATLSASARAFQRTRLRNHGHNVNQLVNLMLGRSADPLEASALTDFLVTSSWRPKPEAFQALHFRGFVGQLRTSHDLKDIDDIFGYHVLSPGSADDVDENIPLLWSGGLIVHPLFVTRTRAYQRRKHLTRNTHIWPLAILSDSFYERNMTHYGFLSAGQQYTDIKLNAYKQPGLVLSSFELFNPHMATFQQLPWMANVSGIPVWTQSGAGSESIGKFGILNTHAPAVQQRGNVLVCTYLAPPFTYQGHVRGLFAQPPCSLLLAQAVFYRGGSVRVGGAAWRCGAVEGG
ncbi:hypothetical protein EON65_39290 [archaeon]|nr:MAG: hypothetical protein EON65_39290 [archaeon]